MRKIALGIGCAALLGTAGTSWAALGVVVDEDFESYADTAAMKAVWAGSGGVLVNYAGAGASNITDDNQDGTKDPEVTLQVDNGASGFHDGGIPGTTGNFVAFNLGSPLVASSTEWIQVSVDIYDNATDLNLFPLVPDNKRMSLGLRAAAGANLVELGMWNTIEHFAYRGILFDSINSTPNPNWQAWDMGEEDLGGTLFPVNRYRGAAWYTYRATIKPESVVYEFDLDYDGTFDYSIEHIDMPHTAAGFDQLRFGSPSGVGSGGGGVTFDNILLEVIAADAPGIPGDLDGDGFVGLSDLDIILNNWNQSIPPGNPLADPTGDNFVGLEDLDIILNNWNAGTPPAAAVPEPATLALLSLGGLAALRRR